MILKTIVTIVFVLVGLMALRLVKGDGPAKVARRDRRTLAKRQRESESLIRCPECARWHAPTERCPCGASPS